MNFWLLPSNEPKSTIYFFALISSTWLSFALIQKTLENILLLGFHSKWLIVLDLCCAIVIPESILTKESPCFDKWCIVSLCHHISNTNLLCYHQLLREITGVITTCMIHYIFWTTCNAVFYHVLFCYENQQINHNASYVFVVMCLPWPSMWHHLMQLPVPTQLCKKCTVVLLFCVLWY